MADESTGKFTANECPISDVGAIGGFLLFVPFG